MCEHGFIGPCAECDGAGQVPEADTEPETTQPFVEPDGLYDERLRLATEKAERLERWLRFIESFDLYEFGGHIGAARAALEGKPAPRW